MNNFIKKNNLHLYINFILTGIIVAGIVLSFKDNTQPLPSYDPGMTRHYIKVGSAAATLRMLQTNVYHIKVVPTSASGTIDISELGISTVFDKQISATRNASDVQISFKSVTPTLITYNITQINTSVVTILGINVLSGLPLVAATDLSNIEINVTLTAY